MKFEITLHQIGKALLVGGLVVMTLMLILLLGFIFLTAPWPISLFIVAVIATGAGAIITEATS